MGLELIGVVHDGQSALNLILDQKPEIVISDIRMPGYDGLELIRIVKEKLPDIYFILVSGYSYFNYAQTAIKNGVEDYLLKPIKKNELTRALNKVIDKHNFQLQKNNEHEMLKQKYVAVEKLALEKVLFDKLLRSADTINFSLQELSQEFGRKFNGRYYTVLKIQPFLPRAIMNEGALSLILNKLQQLAREHFQLFCEEMVITEVDHQVACIININDPTLADLKKISYKLRKDFMNLNDIIAGIRVLIGVGEVTDKVEKLPNIMRQADAALLNHISEPDKFVIEYSKINFSSTNLASIIDKDLISILSTNIEKINVEGVAAIIRQVADRIEHVDHDGLLVFNCYMEIINIFLLNARKFLSDYSLEAADWYAERYWMYMTLKDAFIGLEADIVAIMNKCCEENKIINSRPIRKAKQYINEHYKDAISLEAISAMIGYNPAYFSALFKKETGQNFSDYLTDFRIQKAKLMLAQTELDLTDIVLAIGYSDIKNFSKLFKKMTGLNPTEYRKLYG